MNNNNNNNNDGDELLLFRVCRHYNIIMLQ